MKTQFHSITLSTFHLSLFKLRCQIIQFGVFVGILPKTIWYLNKKPPWMRMRMNAPHLSNIFWICLHSSQPFCFDPPIDRQWFIVLQRRHQSNTWMGDLCGHLFCFDHNLIISFCGDDFPCQDPFCSLWVLLSKLTRTLRAAHVHARAHAQQTSE